MTRGKKIGMTIGLLALTGYGAWALYKKYNPECIEEMENTFKKISKDVEKSIDDMM